MLYWFLFFLFCTLIENSHGISNGTASQHRHPYFVTLIQPRLCGGVFLSLAPEAWILTAAHCVFNTDRNSSSPDGHVRYGNHRHQSFHHVVVHPKYRHNVDTDDDDQRTIHATIYDVALIRLARLPEDEDDHDNDDDDDDDYSSIYYHAMEGNYKQKPREKQVQTIAISTTNASSSLECMGMGATGVGAPMASQLMTAACERTNSTRAIGIFKPYQDAVSMIRTTSALCHGDSGGPLVTPSHRLDGILSRILYAYDPVVPSTCPVPDTDDLQMTNVFVKPAFHLPWISQVTGLDQHTLTTPSNASSSPSYFDILHSSNQGPPSLPVPALWPWVVMALFLLLH
ncbi:hypothetical protein [Absidia glauca]|uniref:Peptidase S1 domain-containing protein n=1 Tax=Absidia glauca TaxID=4829 RepID=A0A168L2S6_ABSGL|nr:hypothetical protein [Absidia glauca]